MEIPFFRPHIGPNTYSYARAAIESVWWSGGHGAYQSFLASALMDMYNRRYCVLTNSGTSACRASLAAAKAKNPERNQVLVPNYSCEANISPVWEQRMEPVFMETGPDGNIAISDVASLPNMFNVSAVFYPYIYGEVPTDIGECHDICYWSDAVLITDISQAVGLDKEFIQGDMVIGSLRTEKFLGCGEGGFILTDDKDLYRAASRFCNWGRVSRSAPYTCTSYGNNLLMPGVSAATAFGQLDVLDEIRESKLESSKMYRFSEVFRDRGDFLPIQTDKTFEPRFTPWQTMFVTENVLASDIITVMAENGIECRPGFYPLELVWKYYNKDYIQTSMYALDPEADMLWKHGVLLPTPYGLTTEEFLVIENVMAKNF